MDTLFAVLGLGTVSVAMVQYFLTINRERVPVSIVPHTVAFAAGMVLSLAAVATHPSGLTIGFGIFSLSFGALLLYLLSIRKLPQGALIAKVGEPMPGLAALDHHGEAFDLSALLGKRVMVKFFRGSW